MVKTCTEKCRMLSGLTFQAATSVCESSTPKTKLALKGNVTLPRCVGRPAHHAIHPGHIPPLEHARGAQQVLQNRVTSEHNSKTRKPSFQSPHDRQLSQLATLPEPEGSLGFPQGPAGETRHSPLMFGFFCLSWGSSGNDRDGVGRQAPRTALPFIGASPTHPN